jgi:hypothetical protein
MNAVNLPNEHENQVWSPQTDADGTPSSGPDSSQIVSALNDAQAEATLGADVLYVGEDGKSFRLGERKVDLSRRRPLARILWALARDGAQMPAMDLIAAGWPGERIVRHAARIRLRVAIATLRSMGLAQQIITTRTGYALSCAISIERGGDTESPMSHTPSSHERVLKSSDVVPSAEGDDVESGAA